jgi:hypothetical protein
LDATNPIAGVQAEGFDAEAAIGHGEAFGSGVPGSLVQEPDA